jgi:IPTL-CTERM motif
MRRTCLLACLLLPVFASPALAGTRPSLEITSSVSGICDNSGGALNPNIPTIINRYVGASTRAVMSVAGVGVVADQVENEPFGGPAFAGTFGFTPAAYNVVAGTAVTVTMTTHFGPNETGGVAYISQIVFACDTGSISSLTNQAFPKPVVIPTTSQFGLLALGALLAIVGLWRLRKLQSWPGRRG